MSEAAVIRARVIEDEEFHVTAWERNPKRMRFGRMFVIISVLVVGLTAPDAVREYRAGNHRWWYGHAAVTFCLPLCWFGFGPGAFRRRIRKAARKHLKDGPIESWYEFSSAGFLFTGQGGRAIFTPWANVIAACRRHDGVSVLMDEQGTGYFWIPDTGFAAEPDRRAALELMRQKVTRFQDRTSK